MSGPSADQGLANAVHRAAQKLNRTIGNAERAGLNVGLTVQSDDAMVYVDIDRPLPPDVNEPVEADADG